MTKTEETTIVLAAYAAGDKTKTKGDQIEHVSDYSLDATHQQQQQQQRNLIYDDEYEDPVLHARTYIALVAMFATNAVQVFALQGPPLVLTQIGISLHDTTHSPWILNAFGIVQAALCPIVASASDAFQSRKIMIIASAIFALIGAAIAPGSKDVYRLIGAQILIGFGVTTVPIVYAVPSEIVPHRWRPLAQAFLNCGASLGACAGPLVMGAMARKDALNGWRNYYYVQVGIWAFVAIGVFIGYKPPKRYAAGLALLLAGLDLGGGLFKWTSAQTLCPLIIGVVTLCAFGVYEWKGTSEGFMNHALFRGGRAAGGTFAICVLLVFIEGIVFFAYVAFNPVLTGVLFETDTLLVAARAQAYWVTSGITTFAWGWIASRFRTIREPLFAAFLLLTAGVVAFATIQPGDNASSLGFSVLSGVGISGCLILITAGVHLSTPHEFIVTASGVITFARAVGGTAWTAIYFAMYSNQLTAKLPAYVAAAAAKNGVPVASIPTFVAGISTNNATLLESVPGMEPSMLADGVLALQQAYADSVRPVFIMAAAFGTAACVLCWFIGDLRSMMNHRVDAPMEKLQPKHHHNNDAVTSAEGWDFEVP